MSGFQFATSMQTALSGQKARESQRILAAFGQLGTSNFGKGRTHQIGAGLGDFLSRARAAASNVVARAKALANNPTVRSVGNFLQNTAQAQCAPCMPIGSLTAAQEGGGTVMQAVKQVAARRAPKRKRAQMEAGDDAVSRLLEDALATV